MKFKSVLAAFAAAAVVTMTSVTAFAETDKDETSNTAAIGSTMVVETVADTATVESDKSSNNSGAEGVAAVLGVFALAGAAVGISRKKA